MSVALHGNLKDFGIAEVFQLIGQQRKTGLLEIAGKGQTVQLAFDEGAVVWAAPLGSTEFAVLGDRLVRCGMITRAKLDELIHESEVSARSLPSLLVESEEIEQGDLEDVSDLLSHETIFEVMRWVGGSFHFTAQPIHHNMPPEKLLAAEQILMDGLRMLDEWQTFKDLVPSDDTVFRRAGRLDVFRAQARQRAGQRAEAIERVHELVDGRLNARRIIDLSRLGTFEATRILAELVQAGVIEALDPRAVRKAMRQQQKPQPVAKRVRWGFAAALPVALLALLVFVGLRENPVRRHLEGTPIARRPLEEVRLQFERRRLHNAIEARRLLTGEWPENLTDQTTNDTFTLAPSSGSPYYYAKRGDGILLLSPKH